MPTSPDKEFPFTIVLKRLEILKNLIILEDHEGIQDSATKLRPYDFHPALAEIIVTVEAKRLSEAIGLIYKMTTVLQELERWKSYDIVTSITPKTDIRRGITLEYWHTLDDNSWKKLININIGKSNKEENIKVDLNPYTTTADEYGTSEEPTLSDLEKINSLTTLTHYSTTRHHRTITNLAPLRYFHNLNKIDFWLNTCISDLSPIQNLHKLVELNFSGSQISDLTPLKYLSKIRVLKLGNSQISDLEPLKYLNNLTVLELGGNQIKDISPIKYLSSLTVLELGNNKIEDISPLQHLSKLTKLNISNNNIYYIKELECLENLKQINLKQNPITDYSPLDHLIGVDIIK